MEVKYSRQRELIINTVKKHKNHPTADMIYSELKVCNPNLSLGTVYRNLNKLAGSGIINKIPTPNGSDRFDGFIEKHNHMICVQCNEVYDIPANTLDTENSDISSKYGVELKDIIFHIVCKNCKK